MAEEEKKDEVKTSSLELNEIKLAEIIKNSQSETIKAALAEIEKQNTAKTPATPATSQTPATRDIWDEILEEKSDPKIRQAAFQGQVAQDIASFYSSDFWQDTIEEWLTGETPEELKAEKREIRKEIEEKFKKLASEGRALPREDIAKFVLAEKLTGNRSKVEASISRRQKKVEESDLEKAKKAVDISAGNMTSFQPEEIYGLPFEKVAEKYGKLTF